MPLFDPQARQQFRRSSVAGLPTSRYNRRASLDSYVHKAVIPKSVHHNTSSKLAPDSKRRSSLAPTQWLNSAVNVKMYEKLQEKSSCKSLNKDLEKGLHHDSNHNKESRSRLDLDHQQSASTPKTPRSSSLPEVDLKHQDTFDRSPIGSPSWTLNVPVIPESEEIPGDSTDESQGTQESRQVAPSQYDESER